MDAPVSSIVIAGGGTAGWLSAAWLAAWARRPGNPPLAITLVESPDIPAIGVGEGTWPTIRETLSGIGISESEFLRECSGSFKQGSRFDGWAGGEGEESYYHPFTPPPLADPRELVAAWRAKDPPQSFAWAMTSQASLCAKDLAPRQRSMPDYAGASNYAYHLDAGSFAGLLRRHAVDRLGVNHVVDTIEHFDGDGADGISAIRTTRMGRLAGDLFLDCTGLRALLIGGQAGASWIDQSQYLPNDRALAAQVPVETGSPVASQTVGTAHEAGWLWDIALPTRRGIGCVYSSKFIDDDRARLILDRYVARHLPKAGDYAVRRIEFPTGHRTHFWVGNCLAVGLSAGFIEPLEASAIVLIELSLRALTESFPQDRARMPFLAERFNAQFTARWERIVEFLKLHYVLSKREEPYWRWHREPSSVPNRLSDLLELWRDQPPSAADFSLADEIFPATSYQYVYYGMGGLVPGRLPPVSEALSGKLEQAAIRGRTLAAALPTNREYLDRLADELVLASEQGNAA